MTTLVQNNSNKMGAESQISPECSAADPISPVKGTHQDEGFLSNEAFVMKLRRNTAETDGDMTYFGTDKSFRSGNSATMRLDEDDDDEEDDDHEELSRSKQRLQMRPTQPACFGGWIVDKLIAHNNLAGGFNNKGNAIILTALSASPSYDSIEGPQQVKEEQQLPQKPNLLAPPPPPAPRSQALTEKDSWEYDDEEEEEADSLRQNSTIFREVRPPHMEDVPPPPDSPPPDSPPTPPDTPRIQLAYSQEPESTPRTPYKQFKRVDVSPLASYGSPPRGLEALQQGVGGYNNKVYSPDVELPHPLKDNADAVPAPSDPPSQIFCSGIDHFASWVGDDMMQTCTVPTVSCGIEACFDFDPVKGLGMLLDEDEDDEALLLPVNRKEQLLDEARVFESAGDLVNAKSRLQQIFVLMEDETDPELALKAEVYHKIGVIQWKEGAYDDALKDLYFSLQLYERAFTSSKNSQDTWNIKTTRGERAEIIAEVLNSIGKADFSKEDYGYALKSFKKAIKMLASTFPTGDEDNNIYHPSFARSATCIGMVYDARGHFAKAMEFYERGLLVQRATLGSNHVDVAATLNSIGAIKEKAASYDVAMDCYSEALWIYRSQLGRGSLPVDVAVTLNNVGFIHFVWGEYNNAMDHYEEALRIMQDNLGPDHRNVASTLYNMAMVFTERGNYDEALQMFKKVLKIQRNSLGDNHTDVAVTLDAIADAYQRQGRSDRAIQFCERSLKIRREALGATHLFVGMSMVKLAKLHLSQGEVLAARVHFREADSVFELNGLDPMEARRYEIQEYLAAQD